MTAEDKIHVGLLVAVAALAGAVIVGRSPSAGTRPGPPLQALPSSAPGEATEPELERTIAELKAWVERSRGRARTAWEVSLALQGLGQAGLDPLHRSRALGSLLSSHADAAGRSPARRASVVAGADADPMGGRVAEDEPVAVLAMLLEAGVGLDAEVELPTGVLVVKQLVEKTLAEAAVMPEPSGWELELLSLATLAGLRQYRERLAYLTQATLTRLDRLHRNAAARAGSGEIAPTTLHAMAEDWRSLTPPRTRAGDDLHSSVAIFRAVAVLAEPDLEIQALRHLNALSFRYQTDRALYQYLLTTSSEPAERIRIRVEALENFGRLGQAFYGAHLAFRRTQRPDTRAATIMRQAAHDVIDQYRALAQANALEVVEASEGSLLRSVVHALRGLRTARVAMARL